MVITTDFNIFADKYHNKQHLPDDLIKMIMNINTEIIKEEKENQWDEWDYAYGSSIEDGKYTIVIAGGGSHWENYVIQKDGAYLENTHGKYKIDGMLVSAQDHICVKPDDYVLKEEECDMYEMVQDCYEEEIMNYIDEDDYEYDSDDYYYNGYDSDDENYMNKIWYNWTSASTYSICLKEGSELVYYYDESDGLYVERDGGDKIKLDEKRLIECYFEDQNQYAIVDINYECNKYERNWIDDSDSD